ncbi:4Fe-4S dicluster domain-containing protein [Eggerthellaceae bacterium zg-1084]|uniref:4Fe-4S dicluster domain-containing protein n=1 Tax=Berryella wangjianweii TaxID=2734634 RepID=UPI0015527D46|nr:4Fe-4S dicluster domain-containing protein [Berryella wangjianweii]NPD30831.1 4Fe-4S dicluster domain-containing protein [Berryella wangjianweii]NPD31698.1 4Fe-4S dicluster domain-containing protein [Eggerthellaceae bacterium zg-997]
MTAPTKRYGMLIDLALCIGCNACVVGCKQENAVARRRFNTWIESFDVDDAGRIRRANVPKQCNHCEDAPCVRVCPTGASLKLDDGVVMVNADACIGCKYCMAACPYQVRYQLDGGEVEKCTFCHHRITEGLMPACVATCVTKARIFGDMNDPNSDIARALAAHSAEGIDEDLGLGPAVRYYGLAETQSMPVVSTVHHGGNVYRLYREEQS